MIDTHAHIYLPEFDEDRERIIERSLQAGINTVLMPAIDTTTHNLMFQVEAHYPQCVPMIGLHPCSVKENFEDELIVVKNYLSSRKFIAVGEIGLDFYWDKTFATQQVKAFHEQVMLSIEYNLPIVIHSRSSIDECINVVQNYPEAKGVFHCFSGTIEQAKKIIALGFMLGIGGVVTFRNAGLDKVIKEIGIEYAVLETDAPYLAPVPYRGKRNEPAYVQAVAEKLAHLVNKTIEEVEELTTRNAVRLFEL